MSRSRRKTPITGMSMAETTKPYKRIRAGNERMHKRVLLRGAILGDEHAMEQLEVESVRWNEWLCPRDGKQWIGNEFPKLMRK